jgi:hypothetical protein
MKNLSKTKIVSAVVALMLLVSPVAVSSVQADAAVNAKCTNIVVNPYGGSSLENCRAALSEGELLSLSLALFATAVVAIAGAKIVSNYVDNA